MDDIDRLSENTTILRRALEGVEETFGVDPFDPEAPQVFDQAIDRALQEAENRANHVAVVCARILDRRTVEWLMCQAKLEVLRNGDIPLATLDHYFKNPTQDLFDKCLRGLENLRSSLAEEGVELPPTELTRDEFCT